MFKEGEAVRLKNLNEMGYVADFINHEMILVEVDGDEIPVFLKDLEKMDKGMELPSMRVTRSKKIMKESQKERFDRGIYLAFLPLRSQKEEITGFKLYLVNHLPYDILSDVTFLLESRDIFRWKKQIEPHSFHPLNKIVFDQLNDSPSVHLKFWTRDQIEGRERHFARLLRVKPRTLFKGESLIPLMEDVKGYVYLVTGDVPAKKKQEPSGITEKDTRKLFRDDSRPSRSSFDVELKANLPIQIDLHIDQLVEDYSEMSNREILRIQLDRCTDYLEKAIINGYDRVYVIHGMGKGRLKEEISKLLKDFDHVTGYRNSYHPKYGYGATEVDLG